MRPVKAAASALSLFLILALAACGPAATTAPGATATALPAATAAATTAAGTTGPVTGDCGEASAAAIKEHLASRPDVLKVSVEGGCHDALIETSLGSGDALEGRKICDLAAQVAYDAGDISSITVVAADSTELSIAIKGQDCIAEL